MSPLTEPTKLVLAKSYVGVDDPDAAAYIAAVEAADGQSLETAVKVAIHSFVKGCKADGIWPAIKASCILAGARTLSGALVPLVGTAPTNNNFVSGDYNRKTGLVGANTKYLASNYAATGSQDNVHLAVLATTYPAATAYIIGTGTGFSGATNFGCFNGTFFRSRNSTIDTINGNPTGFIGFTRQSSGFYVARQGKSDFQFSRSSQSNAGLPPYSVFRSDTTSVADFTGRLAFYSIGEALDLARLDARVTDLINAFGAAIP